LIAVNGVRSSCETSASFARLGERRSHTDTIVGMEDAFEEVVVGRPLVGGVAREVLDPRADVHRARCLQPLGVDAAGQLLGEPLIPPLRVIFRSQL